MKKIFVNSLPKSGTNLVSQCLELMGYRQTGGVDASLISGNVVSSAIRKLYFQSLFSDGYLVGIDMPVELSQKAIDRILNRAKNGEFIAGHVGYTDELLKKIKLMGFSPLLMIRDPRAVLNSFVHYMISNKKHPLHNVFKSISKEEKYRLALYGLTESNVTLKPLIERCMAVNLWMNDEDVLVLRFEDLVGSRGGGSDQIQEKELNALISWTEAGNIDVSDMTKSVFGPGRHTFRKGTINGWCSEMPRNIQQEATEVMHDLIIKWGYGTKL